MAGDNGEEFMAFDDTQRSVVRDAQRSSHLSVEEQQRAVVAANQNSAVARVIRIVYFLFGVLEVLLGLRVVLRLLGANTGNAFADIVYGITQPFIALFANLFANPALAGNNVLEMTTIAAMVVYAILAWIIGRLLWLTLSRPR
jgi:YggT family protein